MRNEAKIEKLLRSIKVSLSRDIYEKLNDTLMSSKLGLDPILQKIYCRSDRENTTSWRVKNLWVGTHWLSDGAWAFTWSHQFSSYCVFLLCCNIHFTTCMQFWTGLMNMSAMFEHFSMPLCSQDIQLHIWSIGKTSMQHKIILSRHLTI